MVNKITCGVASNVSSPSGDEDVRPHPGVGAVAVGGSVVSPSAQWLRSEHSSNPPAPFCLWRSVAGSGCREPTRLLAPTESGSTDAVTGEPESEPELGLYFACHDPVDRIFDSEDTDEEDHEEARIEEVLVAASKWLCERRSGTGRKVVELCPIATVLPVSEDGLTFFCAYPQFLADQTAILLVVLFYACDFPSRIPDHALRKCSHVSNAYTFVQCLLLTSLDYLRLY